MKFRFLTISIFFITILNLPAQVVTIPDVNFRNALLTYSPAIDTNNDGLIQVSEVENLINLYIPNKSISDLTGIEAFTNLKSLTCRDNNLTHIDLSKNLLLLNLELEDNNITSIDISKNIKLQIVGLQNNGLTEIDVSKNLALRELKVERNKLTTIDVSQNTSIWYLNVSDNLLTDLRLNTIKFLGALRAGNNLFTSLNLSCNINLSFVEVTSAALTSICLNSTDYAERTAAIDPDGIYWTKNSTTAWQNCPAIPTVTPIPATIVPIDLCESGDMTFNAVSEEFIAKPTYRWQKATSAGGPWTNISGATNQKLELSNLQMTDNGSIYKVLISSADYCGTGHMEEAAGKIILHPLVYPEVSASASVTGPVCDTIKTITYTAVPVSGEGTDPAYQWYTYTAPTYTPISGATNIQYTPALLPPNGTQLFAGMFTDEMCAVNSGVSSNILTVEILPTPVPEITTNTIALCNPSGFKIETKNTAASGTQFQWYKDGNPITTSNTSTLTIAAEGTYHMTEDNGVCKIASGSVTIDRTSNTPDPQVTITTSLSGPACDTLQQITYTAIPGSATTGNLSYQWYNGTTGLPVSGAVTTVYTPTGKPANGDKVYVIIHTDEACVTNPDVKSNTLTAEILPTPAPAIITNDVALCTPAGFKIETNNTVPSGTQFQWFKDGNPITSSNTSTLTIAAEGTYYMTEDNGACKIASGIVTIDQIPLSPDPEVTIASSLTGPACDTLQKITYIAIPAGSSTGLSYQWYNGATDLPISGAVTTVYIPTTKPANGDKVYVIIHTDEACVTNPDVKSNTLTAEILPTPAPAIITNDVALCKPSGFKIETNNTAPSGTQFQWFKDGNPITSSNTTTLTITAEGNYYMTEDNGVCKIASGPVTIDQIPLSPDPEVTIVSSLTGPACDTLQQITYTAKPESATAGNLSYQWYNGATGLPVSGAVTTVYTPTAKPTNGDKVYVIIHTDAACVTNPDVKSNTLTAEILPTPAPTVLSKDAAVCMPQSYVLSSRPSAFSQTTLQWHKNGTPVTAANSNDYKIPVTELSGGTYFITESNNACSMHSNAVNIEFMQTPLIHPMADVYAAKGELITLHAHVDHAAYYQWNPESTLTNPSTLNPTFKANESTTYTLHATNNKGLCPVTATVNVIIESPIKIPNVITANGDGVNDTWEIENIQNYPNATFEIYNRWGTVVWKSTGYSKQWNGSDAISGKMLPAGTYFYIVDLNGAEKTTSYTGYIQLID